VVYDYTVWLNSSKVQRVMMQLDCVIARILVTETVSLKLPAQVN